ncbi:hypothetical protein SAMN05444412_11712 [Rhodonellum ikkaensis]|nr:hypothetical protein SAMN05444412_11712 [Rhodonellum ikkaensis]
MLRDSNFYSMNSAFFVTLLRNNDHSENHIISPEFRDIDDAATFLDEVITRMEGIRNGLINQDDAGLVYRDLDYTFQVVEDNAYKGIVLVRFEDIDFESSYEHIRDFLLSEQPTLA